jgi:hypothetical protein
VTPRPPKTAAQPIAKPVPAPTPQPQPQPAAQPQQAQQAPVPGKGWGPEFITVAIMNRDECGIQAHGNGTTGLAEDIDKPIPAGGIASICGPVCAHRQPDLWMIAHVDDGDVVRMPGWTPSRVHARVEWQRKGSDTKRLILDQTSIGSYIDPGFPLGTSFPWKVPFTPPGEGTLFLSIVHSDPDSGGLAVVSDAVPVVECPGAEPQDFSNASRETNVWLHVPDPNKPLEVRKIDKDERWNDRAPAYHLLFDDQGYYYVGPAGTKVRLPERP